MTISESLVSWLLAKNIAFVAIETDTLGSTVDSFGLYRSPQRTITRNIDNSTELKETFTFFGKQDGIEESDRKSNDEFWEDFVYMIDDLFQDELPTLDGNRKCTDISVEGYPYVFETLQDQTNIYSCSLSVTYTREAPTE